MNNIKEELKNITYKAYDIKKGRLEKGLSEGLGGKWKVVLKRTNKEKDVLKVDGYGCDSYSTETVYALAAVRGSKGAIAAKEGRETEDSIIFVNMVYGGYFGDSISKFGSDDPNQTIPLERYYGHKVYGDKLDNIINKLAIETAKELINADKEEYNKEIEEINKTIGYANERLEKVKQLENKATLETKEDDGPSPEL